MIPLYPYQQPPQTARLVQGDGTLIPSFWYFLRALFLRSGGDGGIPIVVDPDLAALGASQTTALSLTEDYSEILSGSGNGAILASLQPGQFQIVFNGTGGDVSIYPEVGGEIDALGANAAYTLPNGKTQIFWCTKLRTNGSSFYRSTQLG